MAKYLRNRSSVDKLKTFTNKLVVASNIIDKMDKVIKLSDKAIKIFDGYSRGEDLLFQQSRLKTSRDYKDYYYEVAREASKIASGLKSLSGSLPRGMRDYYEFIFTVAENTDKMAKIFYDHVTRLEVEMTKLAEATKNNPLGSKRSTFFNSYKIINRKGSSANDDFVGTFFDND